MDHFQCPVSLFLLSAVFGPGIHHSHSQFAHHPHRHLLPLDIHPNQVTVGVFWPSMMTMRAHYVPEDLRSTILNCFRIPLNLFVCVILYNVALFPLSAMFGLCAFFLAVAALCQVWLWFSLKLELEGSGGGGPAPFSWHLRS